MPTLQSPELPGRDRMGSGPGWARGWAGRAPGGERGGSGERAERALHGAGLRRGGGAQSRGRGLLWGGGANDETPGLGWEGLELGGVGVGGANEAGRTGRGKWDGGKWGGATRRSYLGCNSWPAFLLHGARAEARLGGKARRACGASGAGGGNEWEPGSGRSTRN